MLTEKLTNSIISKQEGIEIIHSKYGSNQGIDHAFIDKKTDTLWIIDSKQMNKAGGFRVSNEAAGRERQLSREWIRRVAENLGKKNPRESALIKKYVDDGKYQTGVVGVDKKTGEFILVPAKFKNKKINRRKNVKK